jgi:hypothetical protein
MLSNKFKETIFTIIEIFELIKDEYDYYMPYKVDIQHREKSNHPKNNIYS